MPDFELFSTPHLIAMSLTIVVPIALAVIARRRAATAIGYLLAGALMINEVISWRYRFVTFGFEQFVKEHLPLHACGIAALATAAALVFRNQRAYEIAYFWGMVGTLNGVITPELGENQGFPSYRFFQYFISHSGIVIGVLYATWALRMRPDIGGLWRAFIGVNLFAAAMGIFNLVAGSNYMYLCEPPEAASPFFFAPWPWYILIIEFIALAMFFLALAPFSVAAWRSARRSADSA